MGMWLMGTAAPPPALKKADTIALEYPQSAPPYAGTQLFSVPRLVMTATWPTGMAARIPAKSRLDSTALLATARPFVGIH